MRTSGSAGPADQRTSGPANQRISGQEDPRTSRSADQRISAPADQRIRGPADRRTSQRIRQPHDHKSPGPWQTILTRMQPANAWDSSCEPLMLWADGQCSFELIQRNAMNVKPKLSHFYGWADVLPCCCFRSWALVPLLMDDVLY